MSVGDPPDAAAGMLVRCTECGQFNPTEPHYCDGAPRTHFGGIFATPPTPRESPALEEVLRRVIREELTTYFQRRGRL